MIALLLIAGLTVTPIDLGRPVHDVRVADIDADGREDVVAVTDEEILLFRAGKGPPQRRPAAPLVIVGKGLIGVVRAGRYRAVSDPFGEWKEGPPGAPSLLAAFGRGKPRLLDSPGDVDGDGRADAVLAALDGFHAPAGLVPVTPEARLEILRNENFAVEYQIPVPVAGNWSGKQLELVFFHKSAVVSFLGTTPTDRLVLPLLLKGRGVESIRRNHVFVRDIDADGRLDLVVVVAKGSEGLFGAVEAAASVWLGGRIYDRDKQGFLARAAYLKVDGALMAPSLVDVDGDGDLDLVLSTIRTSLLATATGTAPGTYNVFRFAKGSYLRKPAWTHTGPVPMSTFTKKPIPPVTFLRDLDGTSRPKAIEIGASVKLLEASNGRFEEVMEIKFKAAGRPACGSRLAAVRGETGLLLIGAAR